MKIKRKLRVFCVSAAISAFTLVPTFAQGAESVAPIIETKVEGVETRAFIREWRYKVIGDHLYKRLFNCSTQQWETGWILVA